MLNKFLSKILPLCNNVERYCKAGQATDDTIIRRMRIACWVPKATVTHSELIILLFHSDSGLQERTSISRHTCIACLVFSASLRQAVITLHSALG